MPNATFVNLRKARPESVINWSDRCNAVHMYGRLSLLKGEEEGEDLFSQLATARLQPEEHDHALRGSTGTRDPALGLTPVSRDLVETLTLILSLCQRERRATRDERKDPSVDALVRLASLCGERIQVRGVFLLFENSIRN
jgi:hypothetical protein